jgi:transposase, IS5 family
MKARTMAAPLLPAWAMTFLMKYETWAQVLAGACSGVRSMIPFGYLDLEGIMARRRIGQQAFRFGAEEERQTSLDGLSCLIDWRPADFVLAPLYPSAKGEKAWPPLAMFKALLLATRYDLSDVALAEALSDRASFRRFCGFARDEETPERTAFVRFRRLLVEHRLDRSLFDAITRDLESKGAVVRKGTLIDATVIGSASKKDKEAAWVRHRTRAPAHGYKAHIAADKDTGIIRDVETTAANEPDVAIAPSIIPDAPGEVYADKAYDALSVEKAIKATGGTSKLMRKGHRWLPAKKLEAHNRPLRPVRSRIEKIFGTWKRSYHFRSMRWIGLAKARCQVHLAVMAYTIKRFARRQTA